MTSFSIKTFGCKVNTYDTGLLQKRLQAAGFTLAQKAKIHIVNTCAVTAEATREAKREIRRIKLRNPGSLVVVTGCAAQVDKDSFEPLREADLIVANSHKGQLEDIIAQHLRGTSGGRVFHSNIFRKEDLEPGGGSEMQHTRAFLKIQDGCNSFCTYCVIPFARGKSRSLSIVNLVERVNEFHRQAVQEVVLTGVHIGDFEDVDTMNQKQGLEDLIEAILNFTKIPRIRLTSLEPQEVTSRLLELYKNERLCPHFHMSIQSANTKVLSEMRRHYRAEDIEQSLIRIQEKIPNVFVGMDIIVGFPGETDDEFEDTYQRLKKLPWTRIHVFPYSKRPGTKADRREDQVPNAVTLYRAKRLRELSSERFAQRALEQIGTVKSALFLNFTKNVRALSRDYWPIQVKTNQHMTGLEAKVKISGYDHSQKSRMDGVLIGECI